MEGNSSQSSSLTTTASSVSRNTTTSSSSSSRNNSNSSSQQSSRSYYYQQQNKQYNSNTTTGTNNQGKKRKLQILQEKNDVYMLIEESALTKDLDAALTASEFYNHNIANAPPIEDNTEKIRYPYLAITTPVANLIHWMRSETELPSSSTSSASFETFFYDNLVPSFLPLAAFIIPNQEFCEAVLESPDGLDFTHLNGYVDRYIKKVQSHTIQTLPELRFVFLFIELDKTVDKIQKKVKDKSLPQLLDQATVHLMFHYDIEVIRCKKMTDLSEYLHNVCRTLQSTIEKNNSSVFSLVTKAARLKPDDSMEGKEREKFELRQTWSAMLQMIPGMSKEKANAFVSHEKYSCPKKVFDLMNDENVSETVKINGMQSCFGKTKNGVVQNQIKLSKQVYKLMRITDPETLLSEDP